MTPPEIMLEDLLRRHQADFSQVVPFDPTTDRLLLLDFTVNNNQLHPEIVNDTTAFTGYINQQLQHAGATFGIGGYDEHRTVYSRSGVFDGEDEPRRLHLGIDIWGAAGTAVFAPFEGMVHSFAFNEQFGDYGATIILRHELDGFVFHTLYGHLSLTSIQQLTEEFPVKAGVQIAAFGIPEENGRWPPHLHFQLIIDMQGVKGDYPGVCKYTEKEKWLANCPDPDLVLNMLKYGQKG